MVGLWLVLTLVGAAGAAQTGSTFQEGGWDVSGQEAFQLQQELSHGFEGRGQSSIVLAVTDERSAVGEEGFDARAGEAVAEVVEDRGLRVASHVGYGDGGPASESFLGSDGRTTLTMIGSDLTSAEATTALPALQRDLDARFGAEGLRVVLLSSDAFWGEINQESMAGLARAELIALPLIVLVLLILYRSVTATVISLLVTAVAVVVTLGILVLIGQAVPLSSFTLNAVTMLGLGVCIDYSLFIIRRYQQELERGADPRAALATTRATAGHAVIASGLTIAVAMTMLFLVDLMIIRSLALGVVVVVLLSLLVCVLLLPALLALLGRRINLGRIPALGRGGARGPGASRTARTVTTRPAVLLVLGAGVLGVLAVPAAQLTTFTPDVRIVSEQTSVRQGYDTVADAFSVGSTAPVQVMIDAPGGLHDLDPGAVQDLQRHLAEVDGVAGVSSALPAMVQAAPAAPLALADPAVRAALPEAQRKALGLYLDDSGRRLLIDVAPDDWPASETSRHVLTEVRRIAEDTRLEGARVLVGGQTAQGVASNAVIAGALPGVMLGMVAVIAVLLAISFRSVLIPLVAVVLNLLSVGATYGIMVLVFQDGWFAEPLGYSTLGYVQNFVPILLLALLFSLATDYQVFLVSRIREEWTAGAAPREAVSRGLTATAPLITGAAILMVVVFGAFSFTGIVPIQQLGFGLAVGILLDATVVRMVLVPAALSLLGRAAWWWPGRRADRGSFNQAVAAVPEPAGVSDGGSR
jgi:putative drug exporter of the RND superfamily